MLWPRPCALTLLATLALARIGQSQVPVPEPLAPQNPPQTQTAADNDADPNAAPKTPPSTTPASTQTPPRPALTAAQRRQQTEEKLRALMVNLGVTAAATQDAIIGYLAEDEMGRSSVREAEKRMLLGLRRDVPPERMRDLTGDYKTALDSDKTRRAAAQNKLDARVGYSLDPKLEATLWLIGVLGEGGSKLPTSALVVPAPDAPRRPDDAQQLAPGAPIYGPPLSPSFGARGEIVGTVTAKGVTDKGEHWLEIRDDTGALDRYAPLWREDLGALDPDVDAQMTKTPLGARVKVQWLWQERRRALKLQPEDAPPALAP